MSSAESFLDEAPRRTTTAVRAPWWPVGTALLAALAAVTLAVANATLMDPVSRPLLIAGYLLGAIMTTALAAVYRALRNALRRHPQFRVQRHLDRLAVAAMSVGFAAGLANAVLLATELAK